MNQLPNAPKTAARVQWQWKSSSDPFLKTEEPQWTSYSPEHNYLIEKAYYDQKKEMDLGEYIVSIQHLFQRKKGLVVSQRPIRRINCEDNIDEMEIRSERYFETELPKTMNNIFGNLQHFIGFFSRRNLEILDLTKHFQEFEQSNNLDGLNRIICPQLISCLEKELIKPIEEQLQSISLFQKKLILKTKERHEDLICLFQKEFTSFEEFYGVILRSYTMSTNLYLNVNKYLRNENWTAIDNLLLYVICLCKAFFSLKPMISLQKENKIPATIILYRGTALGEEALSCYQNQKTPKLFSWHSVTSTSTNKKIAEEFMYLSADIQNKIYPVMFIIEIPVANKPIESSYLKWIDIHQYSAQPKEDEVILPPGSVFEIQEVSTDQDKRTTINLKLKFDVESLAHEGLIMPGAFQTEMLSDKQFKIMCLKGEDLSEALKNLAGNRLVEEIEFCLCEFINKSVEEMLSILPTLEKARWLKFISCKYEDLQIEIKMSRNCNISKIHINGFQDLLRIFSIQNYWTTMRSLSLDFRNLKTSKAKEATELMSQEFRHFTQLKSLTIIFPNTKEITQEVNDLKALRYLTQLNSLTLNFSYCHLITDEGMNNLASGALKNFTQLTSLTLNFFSCDEITQKGVSHLSLQGLKYLTKLTSLTLHFSYCSEITDEAVNHLAFQALKHLTKLTSLTLDFSSCPQLTSNGVDNLASQALRSLPQLTSLTLDFSGCSKITDEGINHLTFQGLRHLTSCIIAFSQCCEITNEGMKNLAYQGLKYLTKLTSLTLDFSSCSKLTSDGVNSIASQALEYLTQLVSLTLNFSRCLEITDEGVNNMASLKNLIQLTSLTLDFSYCFKLKDESMENLASQGLNRLTQLIYLTLNFSGCSKLTDEGVNSLVHKALKSFKNLASLTLDFAWCEKITDKTMENLQGLRDLTQLTFLTLDFSYCSEITDEGVNNLIDQGLKYLTLLTSLTLNFSGCSKITEKGVSHLISQGLQSLTQLTSLILNDKVIKQSSSHSQTSENQTKMIPNFFSIKMIRNKTHNESKSLQHDQQYSLQPPESLIKFLFELGNSQQTTENLHANTLPFSSEAHNLTSLTLDFSYYPEISDKGVHNFTSSGLKYLTQLTSLTLDFHGCSKITDKGVNYLASQGLGFLAKLASLTLNFSDCDLITDEGVNNLTTQGLQSLPQLISLTLNFCECSLITDEGVRSLMSNGIKQLFCLESLTLDFIGCKISKLTISNIMKVLHYFGFIQKEK